MGVAVGIFFLGVIGAELRWGKFYSPLGHSKVAKNLIPAKVNKLMLLQKRSIRWAGQTKFPGPVWQASPTLPPTCTFSTPQQRGQDQTLLAPQPQLPGYATGAFLPFLVFLCQLCIVPKIPFIE